MEFESIQSPPVARLPDKIACAIGHIAHKFSEIEQILKETIYLLAGVDHTIGRIAIGTARTTDQLSKIEDLMTHRGFAFDPPLTELKKEIDRIEKERDVIIHGVWATDPETGKLILVDHTGKWNVGPRMPRYTRRMYPHGRPVTVHDLTKFHEEIAAAATKALAVYVRVRALRDTSRAPEQPDRPTDDQSQNKSPDQPSPSPELSPEKSGEN